MLGLVVLKIASRSGTEPSVVIISCTIIKHIGTGLVPGHLLDFRNRNIVKVPHNLFMMFEYLTSRRLLHANLLILGVSRIINIWVLLLLSAWLPWLKGELPDETLLGRLLAELLLRGGVVGRPALGRVVGILLLNARLLQVGVIALLKLGEELHL